MVILVITMSHYIICLTITSNFLVDSILKRQKKKKKILTVVLLLKIEAKYKTEEEVIEISLVKRNFTLYFVPVKKYMFKVKVKRHQTVVKTVVLLSLLYTLDTFYTFL